MLFIILQWFLHLSSSQNHNTQEQLIFQSFQVFYLLEQSGDDQLLYMWDWKLEVTYIILGEFKKYINYFLSVPFIDIKYIHIVFQGEKGSGDE